MKLIIATVMCLSIVSLAASKVVEKLRVVDEKTVAADSCTVTGAYNTNGADAGYGLPGYVYTATMKIKVLQKMEAYKVQMTGGFLKKATEVLVPNSTKAAASKTVFRTQSITQLVRYPDESYRLTLQKACEDQILFINTGAYPPPPPKPVVVVPPKKEVPKTPVVPTIPGLPGLPGLPTTPDPLTPNIPVLPGIPGIPGIPGLPTTPEPAVPVIVPPTSTVPGLPSGDTGVNPLFPLGPVPGK